MSNTIFKADEFTLSRVNPEWSAQDLLSQDAIFYLADVARKLRLSSVKVKAHAEGLQARGKNPWEVMGVQKVWAHWMVRMTVFRHYVADHMPPVREPDPSWDGNELLGQTGIFYLVDICAHIPFTPNQIRYQAHRLRASRKEIGVWKDPFLNAFLVDMPVFCKWIKRLWLNGFG